MVEVIEDFEALKDYAQYCRLVLYSMEEAGDTTRVRVRVGRLGFDQYLPKPKLKEIEAWLTAHDALKVVDVVDDAFFFV